MALSRSMRLLVAVLVCAACCVPPALGGAVDDGVAEADRAFAADIAAFVELEASLAVDSESAVSKSVYPILDDTGSAAFTPKANLTRFSVKPVIDASLTLDEPLQPKPAAGTDGALQPIQVKGILGNAARVVIRGVTHFLDGSWLNWLARWGKKYSAVENVRRMAIFLANKSKAAALTLLNAGQYGVSGPFADLDAVEFREKFLRARPVSSPRAAAFFESAAFPEDRRSGEVFVETQADLEQVSAPIDYRSKCTPIKWQKDCGGCWAFAAIQTLETVWAMSGKPLQVLSPQHLIDCNRDDYQFGCDGGSPATALMYLTRIKSFSESAYPYMNGQGTCKSTAGAGPQVKTTGPAIPQCMGGACEGQLESQIPAKLRQYGPLTAIIDSSQMQFYEGGIIKAASGCQYNWDSMNHAVTIVGYHPRDKYWIVRNTWGANWGEKGYMRIEFGKNTCGIANFVHYATV